MYEHSRFNVHVLVHETAYLSKIFVFPLTQLVRDRFSISFTLGHSSSSSDVYYLLTQFYLRHLYYFPPFSMLTCLFVPTFFLLVPSFSQRLGAFQVTAIPLLGTSSPLLSLRFCFPGIHPRTLRTGEPNSRCAKQDKMFFLNISVKVA